MPKQSRHLLPTICQSALWLLLAVAMVACTGDGFQTKQEKGKGGGEDSPFMPPAEVPWTPPADTTDGGEAATTGDDGTTTGGTTDGGEEPEGDPQTTITSFELDNGDTSIAAAQGELANVAWTAETNTGETSQQFLALYIAGENQNACSEGALVATDIPVADGSYNLPTSDLAEGTYSICFRLTTALVSLATGTITVEEFCTGSHLTNDVTENGAGTIVDPFKICTAEQFANMGADQANHVNHFELLKSVDLAAFTDGDYKILGKPGTPFSGTIEGNGHTVRNFNYNSPAEDYVGLIGLAGGEVVIANLTVEDATVVGQNNVGAVAGGASLTLNNVHVINANVTGVENVGGMAGEAAQLLGSNSSATVIGAGNNVGGLIGEATRTLSNIVVNTNVTSSAGTAIGGIAGDLQGSGYEIRDISGTTIVDGISYVGGLFGRAQTDGMFDVNVTTTVDGTGHYIGGAVAEFNCYACPDRRLGMNNISVDTTITATGTLNYVGGIIGYLQGNPNDENYIQNLTATGVVNAPGASSVGGMFGTNNYEYNMRHLDSDVDVTGLNRVGGIFGIVSDYVYLYDMRVTDSVSGGEDVGGVIGYGNYWSYVYRANVSASVGGTTNVGGIFGQSSGQVHQSLVTGAVTGTTRVGAIYGRGSGTIVDSLWDEDTGLVAVMCGQTSGITGCNNSRGYTTMQAQTRATYEALNWDFYDSTADGVNDYFGMGVNEYPHSLPFAAVAPDFSGRFAGGDGSAANPFQIANAGQLASIGENSVLRRANYVLTADIEMMGETLVPIGTSTAPFHGNFDGANRMIENIDFNDNSVSHVGLIGYAEPDYWVESELVGSRIENLTFTNVSMVVNGYSGAAVGACYGCTVENVTVDGTITGSSGSIGLVIGAHLSDTWTPAAFVINSHATGSASGTFSVGGVLGAGEEIRESSASVTINGTSNYVGGLAGRATIIRDSSSTGAVTVTGGAAYTGGLAGSVSSEVSDSYSTITSVNSSGPTVGGLAGQVSGIFENVYATADVTGDQTVGGLFGSATAIRTGERGYATGDVAGDHNVGGVIGLYTNTVNAAYLPLKYLYARGNVTGANNPAADQYVGGLVGAESSTGGGIQYSYATGTVTGGTGVPGDQYVGGILGHTPSGLRLGLVWNGDGQMALPDIGYDDVAMAAVDDSEITQSTAAAMTADNTVFDTAGFDFDNIWNQDAGVNDGYPTF